MNRLFWRFALLVLLAIALGSGVIYFTFSGLFGDPLEHIARDQAAGQIFHNGQISLDHGAFYAIGAYTTGILMEHASMP